MVAEDAEVREGVIIEKRAQVGKEALVLDGARVVEDDKIPAGATWSGYNAAEKQNREDDGLPKVHVTARLHPTAQVHPSAQIGAGTTIGPNTTIGPDCVIGDNTTVKNSTLGASVQVGSKSIVSAATLEERAQVGNRCAVAAVYVGPKATIGLSQESEWSPYHCVDDAKVAGDRTNLRTVDETTVPPTPEEAGIVIGRGASIPGNCVVTPTSVIADGEYFRNEQTPYKATIDHQADRGERDQRRARAAAPTRGRRGQSDGDAPREDDAGQAGGHRQDDERDVRARRRPRLVVAQPPPGGERAGGPAEPPGPAGGADRPHGGRLTGARAARAPVRRAARARPGRMPAANDGIDLLPRHAETGDSFPLDQQIALDVAEYEAGDRGRAYKPATAEQAGQAPSMARWGDRPFQGGIIYVPGKKASGLAVALTVAERPADVLDDPHRRQEMRRHNDDGRHASLLRIAATGSVCRSSGRSRGSGLHTGPSPHV